MLITFHFLLISKLPAKLGILIFVSLGEKKWNLKGLSKFFNVMKLGSDKISSWFQVSISIAKRFPPVTHLPWRKEKGECLDFEEISPERVCSGNWGKSLAIFLTWKSCCAKIYISHWLFFFNCYKTKTKISLCFRKLLSLHISAVLTQTFAVQKATYPPRKCSIVRFQWVYIND